MSKLRKEPQESPMALSGLIIANVITPLDLDPEDQDFVDGEIKWLFSAADNFQQIYQVVQRRLAEETTQLKEQLRQELAGPYKDTLREKRLKEGLAKITPQIWQEEIGRSQPISVSIPPGAERKPQANNQLPSDVEKFWLDRWYGQIENGFKLIGMYLDGLQRLLDQEAMMGTAAKGDVTLQIQIKRARQGVVEILQEIANSMNEAYGIKVTSPDQLLEYLA